MDKILLLKDLCPRLPYGIKCDHFGKIKTVLGVFNDIIQVGYDINDYEDTCIEDIKPYLRPMSSMTEEELKIYHSLCYEVKKEIFECGEWIDEVCYYDTVESIDYLNSIHVDYRFLIEKDLAIAVTEKNNPYKNE